MVGNVNGRDTLHLVTIKIACSMENECFICCYFVITFPKLSEVNICVCAFSVIAEVIIEVETCCLRQMKGNLKCA